MSKFADKLVQCLYLFIRKHFSLQQCITESSHKHWLEDLPAHIIELIMQHLDLSDTIRVKSVCKSWRSLFLHNKKQKYPLLVLPHDSSCKSLSCISLSDFKINDIKLPNSLQGGWCCGSSKGWLFIAKEIFSNDSFAEAYIFLFNPDSGRVCQLPPLSTIPNFHEYAKPLKFCNQIKVSSFIQRIQLSSSDPSTCMVAACFPASANNNLLALCKPGQKHWDIVERRDDYDNDLQLALDLDFYYDDILFFHGELCLLSINAVRVAYYVVELSDGTQVGIRIIPNLAFSHDNGGIVHLQVLGQQFGIVSWFPFMSLAESDNGELLLIRHCSDTFGRSDVLIPLLYGDGDGDGDEDDHDDADEYDDDHELDDPHVDPPERFDDVLYDKKTGFDVFKVDPETGSLCELKDLGDQAIFVHKGGSLVLRASPSLGVQPNSIYFSEFNDYIRQSNYWPSISREIGIYNLNNGRVHRCFPSVPLPLLSTMCWLTIEL